jgi:hypothetical protein
MEVLTSKLDFYDSATNKLNKPRTDIRELNDFKRFYENKEENDTRDNSKFTVANKAALMKGMRDNSFISSDLPSNTQKEFSGKAAPIDLGGQALSLKSGSYLDSHNVLAGLYKADARVISDELHKSAVIYRGVVNDFKKTKDINITIMSEKSFTVVVRAYKQDIKTIVDLIKGGFRKNIDNIILNGKKIFSGKVD